MSDLFSHIVTPRLGVCKHGFAFNLLCTFLSNLHSFQFMLNMAATTPASKRMRMASPTNVVSNQKALDIIHSAQALPFPWKEAVPERISDWFHIVAKSHNTAPEFLFCGCLTTVATLMGPLSSVKVRETYFEPTNIYLVCVAEPGVGKTQAILLSVLDPLSAIGPPISHIHVDDYSYQARSLYAPEEPRAPCSNGLR